MTGVQTCALPISAVEEGDAIRRLEKGHHRRGGLDGVLTHAPVLERRSGNLHVLGQLALTHMGMFLQGLRTLSKFAGDLFSCPGLFSPSLSLVFAHTSTITARPMLPHFCETTVDFWRIQGLIQHRVAETTIKASFWLCQQFLEDDKAQ